MRIMELAEFLKKSEACTAKYVLESGYLEDTGVVFSLGVHEFGAVAVTKAKGKRKSAKVVGTGELKEADSFVLLMATNKNAEGFFYLALYDKEHKNLLGGDTEMGFVFYNTADNNEVVGRLSVIANWQSGITIVGFAEISEIMEQSNNSVLIIFPKFELPETVLKATAVLNSALKGDIKNLLEGGR